MQPMRENGGDVIVVGAGLIGLAIAFELADRGASVRVFDRGEPGRGAHPWTLDENQSRPFEPDQAAGCTPGLHSIVRSTSVGL